MIEDLEEMSLQVSTRWDRSIFVYSRWYSYSYTSVLISYDLLIHSNKHWNEQDLDVLCTVHH